jgi:hypothetical protein
VSYLGRRVHAEGKHAEHIVVAVQCTWQQVLLVKVSWYDVANGLVKGDAKLLSGVSSGWCAFESM